MNNRVLVGGLIGAVTSFLLGYLIWGMALSTMMTESTMAGLSRPMEEIQWLFLILSSFFGGLAIAYILHKANANSFSSGATVAAIVGLLMALAIDLSFYGTTNMFTSTTFLFIDIIANTVVWAIVGGMIGWWYGRGSVVVAGDPGRTL